MAKGRKIVINNSSDWENVFFNSVGVYVQLINNELSKEYKLEKLSNHIKIIGGYAFKNTYYKKHGIPIIRISDFNNEKIILKDVVFYEEAQELEKYALKEYDIIIALTGGTIAKLAIVQSGLGKIYLNQRVGKFQVLQPEQFEKEYVYWIARSVQDVIKKLAWGAAIPNVSPKQIENLEFPFPPKKVQKNIIEFLNDLKQNSLKDKIYFNSIIEKKIIELQKNHFLGLDISLELTNQLNLIKQLRQSFLREAMQGKLVSNDTKDGKTGAELLAEIQTEKEKLIKEKKIKKSKPLPPISKEEIPFEIPENLKLIRLGEIANIEKGKIGIQKAIKGIYPLVVTSEERLSSNEYHFEGASVIVPLVSSTGHGHASMKRIHYQDGKYAVGNILGVIQTYLPNFFNTRFLFNYLDYYKEQFFVEKMKGAANVSLKLSSIQETPIPVIPISAQNKYEELMQYCDQLETSVKESQKLNEQLLQQVLREALQPKAKEVVLPLVAEDREEYNTAKKSLKICDNGSITILAGYIIKKLSTSNPKDFGRVKLQKMLHLVEYQCKLETELHYKQKVAGPYAWELENVIEPKLKTYRFFDIKQDKLSLNNKVTYTALANAKELDFLFQKQFAEISDSINSLLQKFNNKSWEFCEMISTMYAVWNNRIIKNQTINKEELKKDFLAWEEKKIKYQDQIDYAIEWMKKEDLVPIGFGKYIEK